MGTLISHTMATFSAAKTTQLTQFSKAAGHFKNKTVAKASVSNTIEAKGKTCKVAINGFGRIGRNFLRCWHGRGKDTLLEVVAINDSGGVKQASHLVKYDSVLGTFEADVTSSTTRTCPSMARASKLSPPETRCNCRGRN